MTGIFMDRLVDHLFVFEGDGVVKDFPGNYSQYRESTVNSQRQTEKISEKKQSVINNYTADCGQKTPTYFQRKKRIRNTRKRIADLTKKKN
jgi:ATP-binding cassette subfamily F protein uup